MRAEFFNTAEIALNREGQSWGNLGSWKDADHYSDACRDMALALGNAARLDNSSHVFDAGFGCGDQLLLWLRHFRVASVQGVNLSQSQTRLAVEQLKRNGFGHQVNHLMQGDIADPGQWPGPGMPTPNRVLCLDSAYHFPRRERFFSMASTAMGSEGTLCLTDFVRPEQPWRKVQQLPLQAMLSASRIPRHNIMTAQQYEIALNQAGFSGVQFEDISKDVMWGFSNWWALHERRHSTLARRARWKYATTARFLRWAYENNILRYMVIRADTR